jgi:hypothetical protein
MTMTRLGDNANLGDNATPLGARSVTTTPSSETLGNNTKLGNNSTLGDNATLANWPLGNNTKLVVWTLGRDAWQQCHARWRQRQAWQQRRHAVADNDGNDDDNDEDYCGGGCGGGSGKDNEDSGGDIQTTINYKRRTINNQLKETQQSAWTTIKTPSGNRNRDGDMEWWWRCLHLQRWMAAIRRLACIRRLMATEMVENDNTREQMGIG